MVSMMTSQASSSFENLIFSSREEGIRTLDSATNGIHTFQACAFDRSATSLCDCKNRFSWLNLKIYQWLISPRKEVSNKVFITSGVRFLVKRNISLASADSVVMSLPEIMPICRNCSLVSYLPITTLPPMH